MTGRSAILLPRGRRQPQRHRDTHWDTGNPHQCWGQSPDSEVQGHSGRSRVTHTDTVRQAAPRAGTEHRLKTTQPTSLPLQSLKESLQKLNPGLNEEIHV